LSICEEREEVMRLCYCVGRFWRLLYLWVTLLLWVISPYPVWLLTYFIYISLNLSEFVSYSSPLSLIGSPPNKTNEHWLVSLWTIRFSAPCVR
jgi:hypothetical protein